MTIEVGSQVQGRVTNITNFGAFVDLGDNKTGLVHISEIADHFVKDINDELQKNDEILVKVLKIEDNGNIALSIKQSDQPNQTAEKKAARPASTVESSEKRPERKPEKSYQRQESAPRYSSRPRPTSGSSSFSKASKGSGSFDDLMSDFLKDSEERLTSLKRNTEHKRGGRGGRRG